MIDTFIYKFIVDLTNFTYKLSYFKYTSIRNYNSEFVEHKANIYLNKYVLCKNKNVLCKNKNVFSIAKIEDLLNKSVVTLSKVKFIKIKKNDKKIDELILNNWSSVIHIDDWTYRFSLDNVFYEYKRSSCLICGTKYHIACKFSNMNHSFNRIVEEYSNVVLCGSGKTRFIKLHDQIDLLELPDINLNGQSAYIRRCYQLTDDLLYLKIYHNEYIDDYVMLLKLT